MRDDATKAPPKDKLDRLRAKIAELRDLQKERDDLAERMAEKGKRVYEIQSKELVDLFDAAKVDNIGIPEDGNLPAYNMEIGWEYSAKLSSLSDENKLKALAWIKAKEPDIVKTSYTINFGLREEAKRKRFEALLKKEKIEYSSSFGVPSNTLTAWLKEQIEVKKKSPPLKLLGATVERLARIIKPKADRAKKAAVDKRSTAKKGK